MNEGIICKALLSASLGGRGVKVWLTGARALLERAAVPLRGTLWLTGQKADRVHRRGADRPHGAWRERSPGTGLCPVSNPHTTARLAVTLLRIQLPT